MPKILRNREAIPWDTTTRPSEPPPKLNPQSQSPTASDSWVILEEPGELPVGGALGPCRGPRKLQGLGSGLGSIPFLWLP